MTKENNKNQEVSKEDKILSEKLVREGASLAVEGKFDDAIEKFKEAIKLNPENGDAYCNWGSALFEQRKYDEAIEKFKEAIKIDKRNDTAYCLWGLLLDNQGKFDDAIEKFEKATEINPQDDIAYLKWGNILLAQGKYDEAIEMFKEATDINPKNDGAYYEWGLTLHQQRKLEEATKKYKIATEINSQNEKAYFYWGYALWVLSTKYLKERKNSKKARKKLKKAVKKFKKTIKINSKHKEATLFWGASLHGLFKYDQAIDKLKEHIKLTKEDTESKLDAYNYIVSCFTNQKKNDEALIWQNEVIKLSKTLNKKNIIAEAYFEKGHILFSLGKYKSSNNYFTKAKENKEDYWKANFYSSICLARLGDITAIEVFEAINTEYISDLEYGSFGEFLAYPVLNGLSEDLKLLEKAFLYLEKVTQKSRIPYLMTWLWLISYIYFKKVDISYLQERINHIDISDIAKFNPVAYLWLYFAKKENKNIVKFIYENFIIIDERKGNKIFSYTNIGTLNGQLKSYSEKKNKEGLDFWVFNSNYMNDPYEGKTVYKITGIGKIKLEKEPFVYLGCFSLENPTKNLNMWRHYGDDTKGISYGVETRILIHKIHDRRIATSNFKTSTSDYQIETNNTKKSDKDTYSLVKILYINPKDDNKELKQIFNNKYEKGNETYQKALFVLSNMIKHKCYKTEKEIRVLVVKDKDSKDYLGERDFVNLRDFLPINEKKETTIYYTHNCEAKQTIKHLINRADLSDKINLQEITEDDMPYNPKT